MFSELQQIVTKFRRDEFHLFLNIHEISLGGNSKPCKIRLHCFHGVPRSKRTNKLPSDLFPCGIAPYLYGCLKPFKAEFQTILAACNIHVTLVTHYPLTCTKVCFNRIGSRAGSRVSPTSSKSTGIPIRMQFSSVRRKF